MLTCDASKTAIAYVLGQMDNQGREHVIAYGGRSLSKAEQIWSTTEQECLAVLDGIKQFRTYLSRRFKIYTDHKALEYLMDQKVAVEKLGRWALKWQDFDFEIIHKRGSYNQVADALSRITYTEVEDEINEASRVKVFVADAVVAEARSKFDLVESETIEVELFYGEYPVLAPLDPEVLQPKLTDISAIGQLQKVYPDFQNMYAYLSSNALSEEEEVKRKTVAEAQDFSLSDGVLYKWFQKRFKTEENEKYIKQIQLYVFQGFCDMMH